MRIKKHGNKYAGVKDLPKFEKFKCEQCGCEFNCESDEYYEDLGGANDRVGSLAINYMVSTVTKDYLVCSCPECHKVVKKIRERENKCWYSSTLTSTSPSITLNGTNTNDAINKAPKEYTFTCQLENTDKDILNDMLN